MPMVTIDAPEGAPPAAKQKMLKEITEALDEAYRIPDIRCWLREYPAHNVSQDGRVGADTRAQTAGPKPGVGASASRLPDVIADPTLRGATGARPA
jgi:phenylpyruvate tautomerase PptA (4-oxalocrotonate tautomerase family)